MAYKLKDLKKMDDFKYYNEVKAILKLLNDTWNISAEPKGLTEFLKTYTDHDGMDEIDEKALLKSFDGHGDGTVGSDCMVVKLTAAHVAYSVRNQVNGGALEVLIQALLTHGIVLGQRLAEIDRKGEAYKRIDEIRHALVMSADSGDPEMDWIYKRELEFLLDTNHPRSYEEIYEAKEQEIRDLERRRFLPVLSKIMRRKKPIIAYSSKEDEDLRTVWGYIHQQTGSDKRFKAFVEDMKQQNVSIKQDGDCFIITYVKGVK